MLLPACSSDPVQPPPPPPTVVELQIEAGADVNADNAGNGAPIMLRLYELRESDSFNTADFFALFDQEQVTLSADLARKQQFLLKPGETKKLSLQPDDDVHSLGFFAAFRQLDSAQWRGLAEVTIHQTQGYKILLNANRLNIEKINLPQPPKPDAEDED